MEISFIFCVYNLIYYLKMPTFWENFILKIILNLSF